MAALQSSTNRRDWRLHFLLVTNLINEANALRASFLECHLMDDTNHETIVEGQTLRMRVFWLIAVFLVVTVASCAWYFHSVDAQDKRLAQAIKAGGGDVGYRFSGPEWTPQNFRDSAPFLEVVNAVDLSGQEVADDLLQEVTRLTSITELILDRTGLNNRQLGLLRSLRTLKRLSLNDTAITDIGLAHLSSLNRLESLDLRHTATSDEGLRQVVKLVRLKELILGDTKVTDEGLGLLQNLRQLEILDLRHTQVTDAGLDNLSEMKSLKQLFLAHSETTGTGRLFLRQALGECTITPDP